MNQDKSTALRAMGDYIAEHGFTNAFNLPGRNQCGCFIYAARNTQTRWYDVSPVLRDVIGADFWTATLKRAGWDETATLDAAAACYIAADLATPSP